VSDPSVRAMLADVLLYRHELSDHDRDLVDILDLADEAGEQITSWNYSRLSTLHRLHRGENSRD